MGTVTSSDTPCQATGGRRAIVHWDLQDRTGDHNGLRTCGRSPAIRVRLGLGNPGTKMTNEHGKWKAVY